VRTKAPFRVPTSTRTPLTRGSFPRFDPSLELDWAVPSFGFFGSAAGSRVRLRPDFNILSAPAAAPPI
jgi:hypothetical protein